MSTPPFENEYLYLFLSEYRLYIFAEFKANTFNKQLYALKQEFGH